MEHNQGRYPLLPLLLPLPLRGPHSSPRLSNAQTVFQHRPTFSRYLKQVSELIKEAGDNHQLTIALAEEP